jgi:TatD DNase family protein
MQLIDTHVHINFDNFTADLDAVRDRWQSAGVVHLVHSCVTPAEFPKTQALADRFPEISFAVGLHPLDTKEWTTDSPKEILDLAQSDRRVVAIGETGLDFYKAEDRDFQIQVFREQLHIANTLDLPVIIHCRDAAVAMRQVCQEFWENYGRVAGVMHCWSGTPAETAWFLDLGFYISFSGVVTFKNATQIQASAQIVPDDRLLIETDCPFLAPVPRRGKRNEPAYVKHVAEYLAQLRGVSLEELARSTTANAQALFKLGDRVQLTVS